MLFCLLCYVFVSVFVLFFILLFCFSFNWQCTQSWLALTLVCMQGWAIISHVIFCVSAAFRASGLIPECFGFSLQSKQRKFGTFRKSFQRCWPNIRFRFRFSWGTNKNMRVWSLFGGRDMWIKSGMFQGGKGFKILIQP